MLVSFCPAAIRPGGTWLCLRAVASRELSSSGITALDTWPSLGLIGGASTEQESRISEKT